jgi:glucose-1-phosphate adenylyltransferase
MGKSDDLISLVLAGGEGKRLMPLTQDRAKPAVPFGGTYRLIDFVLSNLVNANMRKIAVLTQYKSHSLDRHITTTWRMSSLLNNFVTTVPAQQRLGQRWYTGSADAILQNFNLIHDEDPKFVLVFGADHVYRMDPDQMFEFHKSTGAGVTVAAIRVERESASEFGVIELEEDGLTIKAFHEKPSNPPGIPGDEKWALISMGNYIFNRKLMEATLIEDSHDDASKHDLGTNIIPLLSFRHQAVAYDFSNNHVPGETERDHGYWRDLGTLDSYYEAHMDLISVHPIFNLYNREWPVLTTIPPLPPAKFSDNGTAADSIVGAGAIIAGAHVERSVISYDAILNKGASVYGSVIMPGVKIGQNAVIRNAIIDKSAIIEPNANLGIDIDKDRKNFTVTDSGIVVVGKGQIVTA